jgi:hypothetical protein
MQCENSGKLAQIGGAGMSEEETSELQTLFDQAAKELRTGYVYFRTRIELGNALDQKPDVFEISPVFFIFSLNSFRDASVLSLSRLIEKRNDTLNLRTIEKWIKKDEARLRRARPQPVRNDILLKFRQRLDELEKRTKGIMKARHKEIAHLNLDNVTQNKRVAPIGVDDIEKAYRDIHQSLNELAEGYCGRGIGMLEVAFSLDFRGLLEMAE